MTNKPMKSCSILLRKENQNHNEISLHMCSAEEHANKQKTPEDIEYKNTAVVVGM